MEWLLQATEWQKGSSLTWSPCSESAFSNLVNIICYLNSDHSLKCWSTGNFMDHATTTKLQISLWALNNPAWTSTIDRSPIRGHHLLLHFTSHSPHYQAALWEHLLLTQEFLGTYVIAYIDDILTYSPAEMSHVFHVCQGYVISTNGVAMDNTILKAVRNWPAPCTVKELQRFLDFRNYCQRFIRKFSLIAKPLTSLLKSKENYVD